MHSWSQIVESPLGNAAKSIYQDDPRRHYHGWHHIERLYWHAEQTFDLAYDRDLDLAILTHDIVYDAKHDKELRSIAWLEQHSDVNVSAAAQHIRKTIDHGPSEDNRMVLLDLAEFLFPECAEKNLQRLADESSAIYGIDKVTFLQENISFLKALEERICTPVPACPPEDRATFKKICDGIMHSIAVAHRQLTALQN